VKLASRNIVIVCEELAFGRVYTAKGSCVLFVN